MAESRSLRLDDLGTVSRGKSRHRPRNDSALYGGQYPFFQTGDVRAANFYLSNYSQTYNEVGLAQSKIWPAGTLCITIAANIAETAVLAIPGCFPDSIVGFSPDASKADVRFVKYAIDTMKLRMRQISDGATQDNLSVEKLLSFEFHVPALPVQAKIAAVLSAYDDLIENNRRRIEILEETARAVYADSLKSYSHELRRLSELVVLTMGQSPRSEFYNSDGQGLPFHQGVGSYGSHIPTHKIYSSQGTRSANLGDVLLSVRAPVGRINVADRKLILGRGLASVRFAEGARAYGLNVLRKVFSEEDSMGSGAIYNAVTRADLEGLEVPWADENVIEQLDAKLVPLEELMVSLSKQNLNLAAQRDLLLPKLISGELDVSELDIDTGRIEEQEKLWRESASV